MSHLRRNTRAPSSAAGFTLLELIVVVIVGGLLLSSLTSFYLSEQRALRQQQIQIETSQSLRVALEQMVRDLRVAGRNPADATGIGFIAASATSLEFTLDADDDGAVNLSDPAEHKGFRLQGSELQTYVPAAGLVTNWQPLATAMASSSTVFTYYDANNNPIASPSANLTAIRRIDIVLTVTNRVPAGPNIRRTETASVRLRKNLS